MNYNDSDYFSMENPDDFENPYGYPEVGVRNQVGVKSDFMEKSGRYGGHPVSSGAGIVNDPNYQDSESEINKQLQKQMMGEQLRMQGFDVQEAIVQPFVEEHMLYMVEQDNLNQFGEIIPPKDKFKDSNLFPPMPGYHLSYFANMAFYVPEAMGLDNVMTNLMWLDSPETFYMRYLVLTTTYMQLIPIAGQAFSRGMIAYAMKPNVAFPNKAQIEGCKEPLQWDRILLDDFTGHGNKLGTIYYKTKHSREVASNVLQGTGKIVVKGAIADVDVGIKKRVGGVFDSIGSYTPSGHGLASDIGTDIGKAIAKEIKKLLPKKKKKKKKKWWEL